MKHQSPRPSRVYGSSPVVIAAVMTSLGLAGVAGSVTYAAASPESTLRAGGTQTGPATQRPSGTTTSISSPTSSNPESTGSPAAPSNPTETGSSPTTSATPGGGGNGSSSIPVLPNLPDSSKPSAPGRWVWVPDADGSQGSKSFQLCRIRWGDTLSGISARTGVPIAMLVRDNNIENPNLIYAGDVLRIPIS